MDLKSIKEFIKLNKLALAASLGGLVLALWLAYEWSSPSKKSPSHSSQSGNPAAESKPSSEGGVKEIVWAGLAGVPPRYFDSGENRGLGYLEVQSKEIRKALTGAGYQLRYEYYATPRLDYEFTQKRPLCFYPFQWRDPKTYFQKKTDRILSIPLDFNESSHKIIIRKGEEQRFKHLRDKTGNIKLSHLLRDTGLKTLLPSVKELPDEFRAVYLVQKDGTFEIAPEFQKNISTRRFHENSQLIQMLKGNRIDYLFDVFVEAEDYQMVGRRDLLFSQLTYDSKSVTQILDPRINFSSVACTIHPLSIEAMPIINSAIAQVRGNSWLLKNLAYQRNFDSEIKVPDSYNTFPYRFPEVTQGKADGWYADQVAQIEGLKLFAPEAKELEGPPPVASGHVRPRWLALRPRHGSLWILHEVDFLDLQMLSKGHLRFSQIWQGYYESERMTSFWSQEERELLSKMKSENLEGSEDFRDVVQRWVARADEIEDFRILARGLSGGDLKLAAPLVRGKRLRTLSLNYLNSDAAGVILPEVPFNLEGFNLGGSSLGKVEVGPILSKMKQLKSLNLSVTRLQAGDFANALLSLPSELEVLSAGWNLSDWSPLLANQFGSKPFPKLRVLDLENSGLSDLHCPLFTGVGSALRELRLNLNFLTSNCLGKVFNRPFPNLMMLELNSILISNRPGIQLKIPGSVQLLDLSQAKLDAERLSHIQLPSGLKGLRVFENDLNSAALKSLFAHLGPHLEVLDLADASKSGDEVLSLLSGSKVKTIQELDLSGIPIGNKNYQEWAQKSPIESMASLDLSGSGLKNDGLKSIAERWGSKLLSIDVSQNGITEAGISNLSEQAPQLMELIASQLISLDLGLLSAAFPKKLRKLSLSGNDLTDRDLEALKLILPSHLRVLNLAQSKFRSAGAKALAHAAPNLISLNLTGINPGDSGWAWIASGLSPYLKELSIGSGTLSAATTELWTKNIPPHLAGLDLNGMHFDAKSSREFFSSIHDGLIFFGFVGNGTWTEAAAQAFSSLNSKSLNRMMITTDRLSSKGYRLLFESLPDSLHALHLVTHLPDQIALSALGQRLSNRVPVVELSRLKASGSVLKEFKNARPLAFAGFGMQLEGSLISDLGKEFFERAQIIMLNGVKMEGSDLIQLMRNLPAGLSHMTLRSVNLKYQQVEPLIAALPRGLRSLDLGGNEIGAAGIQKLEDYKRKIELETGLPLELVTE